MARLKDDLFYKQNGGYQAPDDRMVNVEFGGMFGYSPLIGGNDGTDQYSEWISNQAHVSKNVIAVVLQAPKFFDYMPNSSQYVSAFKAMFELHAKTITGLNRTLTVTHAEHDLGGTLEKQEEVVNVNRERTVLATTHQEKLGRPFQKLLEAWIRYGMMDPDTKTPLIATLARDGKLPKAFDPKFYTAEFYTATVLFIETDITNRHVEDAYICTNVMPKGTGEWIAKKDMAADGELSELSIEWTSITSSNIFSKKIAQNMIDKMSVFKHLPEIGTVVVNPNEPQNANLQDASTPHGYNRGGIS